MIESKQSFIESHNEDDLSVSATDSPLLESMKEGTLFQINYYDIRN